MPEKQRTRRGTTVCAGVQVDPTGDAMAQPVHAQPVYAQPVYHYHVSQAPAAKPGPPANPGPLGLFGFGMTTTTLCFVISEWAKGPFADTVVGYALAYGGATQWVAGLLEMFNGNTFGGTAFMSYGAFWIAWWYSGFVLQAPLETTGAGLVHALVRGDGGGGFARKHVLPSGPLCVHPSPVTLPLPPCLSGVS